MGWRDDKDTISTVEQLTDNIPALENTSITDAFLSKCIEAADQIIYDDLSKYVDWDDVEALDEVPRVLDRLSQYKSAEVALIRTWRDEENILMDDTLSNSILKHFQSEYNKLLAQIQQGDILILDSGHDVLEEDTWRTPGVGRII